MLTCFLPFRPLRWAARVGLALGLGWAVAAGTPVAAQGLVPPTARALSVDQVERLLAQAVAEAQAQGRPATIAIVDRVGNVLAVYAMAGAPPAIRIRPGPAASQAPLPPGTLNGFTLPPGFEAGNVGLQGVLVPRTLAAISKAITGAYLSSGGNAFSTRTASMIVQPHFPPAPFTFGLESGPLFGVQFSQLACSDLSTRYQQGTFDWIGPNRAPLGLAADPGGLPLYIGGVLVGGIGVAADDDYGFDSDVSDRDRDVDELIAVAGAAGFMAPVEIRADRITVDGTLLRFVDSEAIRSNPASVPAFASLTAVGALVPVRGYFGDVGIVASVPAIRNGVVYGLPTSGIRPAGPGGVDPRGFVLVDEDGRERFAPRGGSDASSTGNAPLTEGEVRVLLQEAFAVMARSRAQIRRPLNSTAQVTISVVDSFGQVLGLIRSPDAPVFGTDVSLQKARSAAFFSVRETALALSAATRAPALVGGAVVPDRALIGYAQSLVGSLGSGPMSGGTGFGVRGLGNLARPHFPDGEVDAGPGPASRPISQWSPFATGLQETLIADNIVQHVGFVLGAAPDTPQQCSFLPNQGPADERLARLANGLQIFAGGVPIYRGGVVVGGIGVSGDGVDQDDMIGFLGLHNAGQRLGGAIGNAPRAVRSDRLVASAQGRSARLRFVNCPFTPFLDSRDQNVCAGK